MNKKKLFTLHSYLALFALLPLLVICLTGSILVFKPELDAWLMPDKAALSQVQGERQDLDTLLDKVHASHPDFEVGTWEIFDNHEDADMVYLIKKGTFEWYKVYLDPYRGEVLSEPVSVHHYLTDWLLELHFTLLLSNTGLIVGFVIALILLFLGISGIILHRKFWTKLFTLRLGRAKAIFFSDLHKMVGIFASPVLLILGFTGGYWNMAEFIHETYEHTAEQEAFVMTERMYSDAVSIDALLKDSATQLEGFEATYLVLAYEPGVNLSFYGKVPTTNPLYSDYGSGVSYKPDTGEFLMAWDIHKLPVLPVVLDTFRTLHFGTFAGMTVRIIWCIGGAMPLILSISGVYLWYSRRAKKAQAKHNRRQQSHKPQTA